jgi:hypothetical protein
MKYIRTEKMGIITFPLRINHKVMVEKVMVDDDKLISAGFVGSYDASMISCFGESVTVKKAVFQGDVDRVSDTKYIRQMLES